MNPKIWFYKHFMKNRIIRTIYFDDSKQVHMLYAIPKGKQFALGGKTYETNQDDFFLMGGIPTYVHRSGRIEPINPFETKKSVMSEEYYNTAINSQLAKEAFSKTDDSDENKTLMMVMMGLAVLLIVLGGFVYMQFDELFAMLNEIYPSASGSGVR